MKKVLLFWLTLGFTSISKAERLRIDTPISQVHLYGLQKIELRCQKNSDPAVEINVSSQPSSVIDAGKFLNFEAQNSVHLMVDSKALVKADKKVFVAMYLDGNIDEGNESYRYTGDVDQGRFDLFQLLKPQVRITSGKYEIWIERKFEGLYERLGRFPNVYTLQSSGSMLSINEKGKRKAVDHRLDRCTLQLTFDKDP